MKNTLLFLVVLAIAGCNSMRCEFTRPDEMSPELHQLCVAHASSTKVNVSNSNH